MRRDAVTDAPIDPARDHARDHAREVIETALTNPAQRPVVKSFFDPATFTVSHVVRDPGSNACAIIDSVLDYDQAAGRTSTASADALIAYVEAEDLEVQWLLESHAHADHLSAAPYLQERLGGRLAIGRDIIKVQDVFGKVFNEGTEFRRDATLSMPRLILPSVQVNMNGGRMPEPEDNGVRYLKVPINAL